MIPETVKRLSSPTCLSFLLLLILLLPTTRGECLLNPVRRDIYYEACRQGWAILQDIQLTIKSVPSATYCASKCISLPGCASFNIKTAIGEMSVSQEGKSRRITLAELLGISSIEQESQ
ncbi:hypothetical protein ElyMa_001278800 [Elysia marginata]|uniref:Apple domain-containing protein n=1 Tax=Elysia marginata TaxID=1093978 RepID=A0AAV4IIR4_9GAST|nr:hypothetical protein ElyMa_001278800 [Elysia marginata]